MPWLLLHLSVCLAAPVYAQPLAQDAVDVPAAESLDGRSQRLLDPAPASALPPKDPYQNRLSLKEVGISAAALAGLDVVAYLLIVSMVSNTTGNSLGDGLLLLLGIELVLLVDLVAAPFLSALVTRLASGGKYSGSMGRTIGFSVLAHVAVLAAEYLLLTMAESRGYPVGLIAVAIALWVVGHYGGLPAMSSFMLHRGSGRSDEPEPSTEPMPMPTPAPAAPAGIPPQLQLMVPLLAFRF